MKIQFASDLHLEMSANAAWIQSHPLEVAGEILVLAGDTAYLEEGVPDWFLDWASTSYKQVMLIPGNHEFYKFYDIAKLNDGYCLEIRPNVHSYYNAVVHIGDIDFIITTLWAKIPLKESYYTEQVVSDFRRIIFNGEHERCLAFLKDAISNSRARRKIVVTHHVPSFQMQCPKFADSQANGAFTVELEDYIKDSGIDYWIYGHSHYNVDVKIGNTKCVSNQLGYVFHGEHEFFNPGKSLEV